jgi:hypothetical protein
MHLTPNRPTRVIDTLHKIGDVDVGKHTSTIG